MAGDLEARRPYGAELVEGSVMAGGREDGGRKDGGKEGLGFTPSKTGTITWSVSPQGSLTQWVDKLSPGSSDAQEIRRAPPPKRKAVSFPPPPWLPAHSPFWE